MAAQNSACEESFGRVGGEIKEHSLFDLHNFIENMLLMDAINEVNATSVKDMGSVMRVVSPKVKGKADMSLVSTIIKSKLN